MLQRGVFGQAEGRYFEEYFSPLIADKASGIVTICPKCAKKNLETYGNEYGAEGEESGYFTCSDCGKLQQYSHSWEIYATVDENGYHCMKCMGERELGPESAKWQDSALDIKSATESVEALQDYKPRHLTCIQGHKVLPCGALSFRDTPEYEANHINWLGAMEMGGWGGNNVNEVRECALEAFRFYSEVAIIVAEAGQFQVYLDIVVHPDKRRKTPRPAKKAHAVA